MRRDSADGLDAPNLIRVIIAAMTPASTRPGRSCTAFDGPTRVASGPLDDVAVRLRRRLARHPDARLLVFDDHTGALVDVDLGGGEGAVRQRVVSKTPERVGVDTPAVAAPARGPGRPRLGVVAREVTLLPRHWEWLGSQPGGASVALRRLVDEARKARAGADARRRSQEAAYRFMTAVAGDYPGYEEALRALFAGSADGFDACVRAWPADVSAYARHLAAGALAAREEAS